MKEVIATVKPFLAGQREDVVDPIVAVARSGRMGHGRIFHGVGDRAGDGVMAGDGGWIVDDPLLP